MDPNNRAFIYRAPLVALSLSTYMCLSCMPTSAEEEEEQQNGPQAQAHLSIGA